MSLLMQALKKAERAKQNSLSDEELEKPSEAYDQVLELAPADAPPPRHKRSGLFAPIGLFIVALIAWSIWWFVLAGQVRSQLDQRVEAMRAGGWDVTYTGLGTSGWPFRVRLGAENVSITAPSGLAGVIRHGRAFCAAKWLAISCSCSSLKPLVIWCITVAGAAPLR